jgi:L-2,4-diaminobutyrate transaminase
MKSKDELRDLDVNYLFHPTIVLEEHQKSGPRIIVEGDGVHVRDIDGNQYTDALDASITQMEEGML